MCIDLLCRGKCLDVLYLFEQIWLDVNMAEPHKLLLTEVYDVLLRIPKGAGRVNEVWALFPHNCSVKAPRVLPWNERGDETTDDGNADDKKADDKKYDWVFNGTPNWVDPVTKTHIVRDVPYESQETFGKPYAKVEGLSLLVKEPDIDFPDISRGKPNDPRKPQGFEKHKEIMAGIKKTLLRIPFPETPLKEGETGWLRLVVTPTDLDAMPSVPVGPPVAPLGGEANDDYALCFEQRHDIWCPLVLRAKVHDRLPQGDYEAEEIRLFLQSLFSGDTATCTRICDHRILLCLPTRGLDVHDAICTKGAHYYGMLDLRPDYDRRAYVWSSGSIRNLEDDLIHNAMRIVNRVTLFPEDSRERVVTSQLSPSGKYEAFALLVGLMKNGGKLILEKEGNDARNEDQGPLLRVNNQQKYGTNSLPQEDEFDFSPLRKIYLTRNVRDNDKKLVTEFRDLHPFRISFRVTWANPSERLRQLVAALLDLAQKASKVPSQT
jgi:hypothetical protein